MARDRINWSESRLVDYANKGESRERCLMWKHFEEWLLVKAAVFFRQGDDDKASLIRQLSRELIPEHAKEKEAFDRLFDEYIKKYGT